MLRQLIRALFLLLALLAPGAARSQAPAAVCVAQPSYFGCYPPAVASRATTMPAATPLGPREVSIGQVLGAMLPGDVPDTLKPWLPPGSTSYSAALTALCASTSADLDVVLPAGTVVFDASVTGCNNRSLRLRGHGLGISVVIVTHAGVALDVAEDYPWRNVTLEGFTAYSSSPTGTLALVRATYPLVSSSSRSSVVVRDVEITSSPAPGVANSWCKGVVLVGAWAPRLTHVSMTGALLLSPPASSGPTTNPTPLGCSLLDISETFDPMVESSTMYWGDSLVFQSGYAEGVRMASNGVVGTNWLFNQGPSIVKRAGFAVNGLWVTSNEINTYLGGLNIADAVLGPMATGNHFYRWAVPSIYSVQWVGYVLLNVNRTNSTGDLLQGGGYGPQSMNGISLTVSHDPVSGAVTGSSAGNIFTGPTLDGMNNAVAFGPGTAGNAVVGAYSQPGAYYVDQGTNNTLTHHTATGAP